MPDIAETDSYGMLCEDWGTAYLITRTAGNDRLYQAERRDDPGVVLQTATPGALRELIRTDYFARPVPREIAPLTAPASPGASPHGRPPSPRSPRRPVTRCPP